MVKFHIISIFPRIFDSYFSESIIKRAIQKKKIQIKIWNLRDFAKGRHRQVDDKPYGGGAGMVFKLEPLVRAISKLQIPKSKAQIILFSATGKQFNSKLAQSWARDYKRLILICGHYEGIDARLEKILKTINYKLQTISVGPYVLTGGELPAMIVVDAVSRHVPGVLGKAESLEEKRFGVGVPVYTRPEVLKFKGKTYRVPRILLSGDHKKIEEWRKIHRK